MNRRKDRKAVLLFLLVICLVTAVGVGALAKSESWPKDWEVYQGIVVGKSTMAEAEERLGQPREVSRANNLPGEESVIYRYDDYMLLGLDDIVQFIAIKSPAAPGALGELAVKVGDSFDSVYAKLPEERIKVVRDDDRQKDETYQAIKDDKFVIYLLALSDEDNISTKNMVIVLKNNITVQLNFDDEEILSVIRIGKGSIIAN